jgi:hypothetical protein
MSQFRETVPTSGNEPKDETYKKIISKKHVPDIDKGALLFRLISSDPKDFHHFMKFWLNVGKKSDGTYISIPRVSANPFKDFIVSDGRGGTRIIRTAAAAKGCVLSKLAENNHPLINLSSYVDSSGKPKKNIDPIHVTKVQIIERVKDEQGRPMKNENGAPMLKILPDEMLLEMPQSWWDQFVNIVDPAPQASQVENDLRESLPSKQLPTKDLTRIVWMVYKQRRTKNITGDPRKDIDYIVDFSSKVVLSDKQIPKVENPLDISKAYQIPTKEDLDRWIQKAESGWAESGNDDMDDLADDPESYGQRVPELDSSSDVPF